MEWNNLYKGSDFFWAENWFLKVRLALLVGLRGVKHFRENLMLLQFCSWIFGFINSSEQKKRRHFFALRVRIWQLQGYTQMGTNSSQSIVSFWMKVPQPSNDMSSGLIFHGEIVSKYACEVLIKVSAEKWDFVQKEIPCLQKIIIFLRVPCEWRNLALGFQTFFLRFIFCPAKIIQFDRTGRTPHVMFKLF